MVERQFDRRIKRIRTDNAKDFINHEFQKFCTELGIIHETSCAYTPQQNGIAERRIGLIQEKGRSLLIQSNVTRRDREVIDFTRSRVKNNA